MKTYSDKELLTLLRDFSERHGFVPRCIDAGHGSMLPSRTTFELHFGSWNNALKAASLEPRAAYKGGPRTYSDEELLIALRKHAHSLGYVPTEADFKRGKAKGLPALTTIKVRFGGMESALRRAGIRYNKLRFKLRSSLIYLAYLMQGLSHRLRERIWHDADGEQETNR